MGMKAVMAAQVKSLPFWIQEDAEEADYPSWFFKDVTFTKLQSMWSSLRIMESQT